MIGFMWLLIPLDVSKFAEVQSSIMDEQDLSILHKVTLKDGDGNQDLLSEDHDLIMLKYNYLGGNENIHYRISSGRFQGTTLVLRTRVLSSIWDQMKSRRLASVTVEALGLKPDGSSWGPQPLGMTIITPPAIE